MVKILSWNILQGGGSRATAITEAISNYAPDILTLQEFRNGSASDEILRALDKAGLTFQHIPHTANPGENTILIASRFGFDAGPFMPNYDETKQLHILEAAFNEDALGFPLTMMAAHFPQKKPQLPLFDALLEESASLLSGDTLLIGDLNCGIPFEDSMTKTFFATGRFQAMLEAGWIDTWRIRHKDAREYTWVSSVKKHGFRYDQALASPSMNARMKTVEYDHSVREARTSDHSAMLVELK